MKAAERERLIWRFGDLITERAETSTGRASAAVHSKRLPYG